MTARKPKKRGQKLLLNAKVKKELISAIQAGATYELACQYAGISYSAMYNWMKQGAAEQSRVDEANEGKLPDEPHEEIAKEKKIFVEFMKAIHDAAGIAAINWLQVIDAAAQIDPNWAAYMLRVRYPKDYGGRTTIEAAASGDSKAGDEIIIRIQYVNPVPPQKIIDEG